MFFGVQTSESRQGEASIRPHSLLENLCGRKEKLWKFIKFQWKEGVEPSRRAWLEVQQRSTIHITLKQKEKSSGDIKFSLKCQWWRYAKLKKNVKSKTSEKWKFILNIQIALLKICDEFYEILLKLIHSIPFSFYWLFIINHQWASCLISLVYICSADVISVVYA